MTLVWAYLCRITLLRNLKKEVATWFVHCVYVGGTGGLDIKYLILQSLKLHSSCLTFFKMNTGTET